MRVSDFHSVAEEISDDLSTLELKQAALSGHKMSVAGQVCTEARWFLDDYVGEDLYTWWDSGI